MFQDLRKGGNTMNNIKRFREERPLMDEIMADITEA